MNLKNTSWLQPCFDEFPIKKYAAQKRSSTAKLQETTPKLAKLHNAFEKKEIINSLSALIQACEPKNSSELAISKQKQKEISEWFQHKAQRGKPSALVIYGPSGCGKTVALKVLAKENKFNVKEWITPIDQILDDSNKIVRQADKFEEFIIRATRYNSVLCSYSRQVLLVKDFPNVFLEDKYSFYNILEKYFEFGKEPAIFICTENGDSQMMRTLFTSEVTNRFGIDVINVNAVTQTAMKNMLKRVSVILQKNVSHFLDVTQEVLDEVLSNNTGDVRNAILNLIFSSLKVPDGVKKNEIGKREENLGLLHGVGRVINPKRIPEGSSWKFVHDPDEIAVYFQSQISTFVQFLQENYLNTMRTIDEVTRAADDLSLGDVLSAEWRDLNLGELTLALCIRGVMTNNINPVSGWNPVRKPPSEYSIARRELSSLETKWYKSKIKPNKKKVGAAPVDDDADNGDDDDDAKLITES